MKMCVFGPMMAHSKCANRQKGNSKNKKNELQYRKRNLDVKMSKFERFVLFFLQYLNTSTTGVILITQLVCKFEKTRADYSQQMYSYLIMKPQPPYMESTSGHKNLWKYSKTRKHECRQDPSMMWLIQWQLMKLQYIRIMDLSIYRIQSYNLYIGYVVFYKKLELCQTGHKKQCDKERKKLKKVENEYICYPLCQVCTCHAGQSEYSQKFEQIENFNRMQQEKNEDMRQQLLKNNDMIKELKKQLEVLKSDKLVLERKNVVLKDKLSMWKNKHEKIEKEYGELVLEYGRLSVENDSNVNKVKETKQFQKIFIPKSSASSVPNIQGNNSCKCGPIQNVLSENRVSLFSSSSSISPSRKQSVSAQLLEVSEGEGNSQKKNELNGRDLNTENESKVSKEQPRFSVEVVERNNQGCISLINQTSSSVPADVYNAYKFLLLTISDWLLYDDIIKLQKWANEKFSVEANLNAYEVFMELDKKGVISALDLSQLSVFFDSIVRHDLLYLIDEYKNGDYDKLRKLVYQNKRSRKVKNSNLERSPRFRVPKSNTPGSSQRCASNGQANVSDTQVIVSNSCVLERPSGNEDNNPTSHVGRDHQGSARFGSNFPSTSSYRVRSGLLMQGNSENVPDVSAVTNTRGNPENEHTINANDTPVMTEPVRHKRTLQSGQPPFQCNHSHNAAGRCDGTHSHTDAHLLGASNGNNQDNWLCDHYKRRCWVKFECCDRYWACHRCHNNESTCGHRKLKSRDTTMIKCVECGKEQKFGQFCVSCNTQFADFFCGICKHLTGTDDHPYHCDKCGICRIHGDRSYHCDVCGICLDVQLRGNHKCRPDSAHDECCICLEDAFTGCQILPCSHKVHKDCATQMIRMGITRCPMCRESFAHKLERRPVKKKTTRRRHRTSPANS